MFPSYKCTQLRLNQHVHQHSQIIIFVVCMSLAIQSVSYEDSDQNVQMCRLGPVVQSIVSLTTSLRVISLTVSADPIYNILIFFAEKM